MGMSTSRGGARGGGGFGGRSVPTTLAEINVTPLVDVMLVLLIVFMVSAPMMQQGVHVDLPRANAGSLDEVPDQLVLVVNKNRQILINNNVIESGMLRPKLEAVASVKPNVQVFIQADQSVPYGYIASVMAEVKKSKISRVGLVTEPGESGYKL
jgi:biopolymer transport protein TolR